MDAEMGRTSQTWLIMMANTSAVLILGQREALNLRDNDGRCKILRVSSNVAQHHDSRQANVTTSITDIVDHCSHTTCIDYQL